MITMYGAMAQSESKSISGNIRRGRQMHAKVGMLKVPCYRLYGYEKDADGKFCIMPEQAEIVRELYKRYESGAACEIYKTGWKKIRSKRFSGNPNGQRLPSRES